MTLKGGTNHYNVKFLKGYGFSVNVKDNKIVLKNCYDPFSEPQIEGWYVKNMPYEKIVLSGKDSEILCSFNRTSVNLPNQRRPLSPLKLPSTKSIASISLYYMNYLLKVSCF